MISKLATPWFSKTLQMLIFITNVHVHGFINAAIDTIVKSNQN